VEVEPVELSVTDTRTCRKIADMTDGALIAVV
jgi:hypothetical protein